MNKKDPILQSEGVGKIQVQEVDEAPKTTMAEKMDAAAEAAGKKVLRAEMISQAHSFNDLLKTIAEINVMHGKKVKMISPDTMRRSNDSEVTSTRVLDYTSKELLESVKAASGLIDELGQHHPENLKIPVGELPTEMTARFKHIPEENGLRAKVLALYEEKRLAKLNRSENEEAPKEPTPLEVKHSQPEAAPLEALPSPQIEEKEVVIAKEMQPENVSKINLENEPSLKKLEIDYLRSVVEYRNKLKASYNSLNEKRSRTDFISRMKRFVGRSEHLSEEEMEELENLRHIPVLIRDHILATTRSLITNDGGDSKAITMAIFNTEKRLKADLKSLSESAEPIEEDENDAAHAGPTIPTEGETREFERLAFEGKSFSSSKISRHQTYKQYIEQKNKEEANEEGLDPYVAEITPITAPHDARVAAAEAALPKRIRRKSIETKEQDDSKNKVPEVVSVKPEAPSSPEKTIAALKLLEKMKGDSKKISSKAAEMMGASGRIALNAFKSVGGWYNKRSKTEKIALACSIAALSLSGAVIGGALGAKFLASALVARNVKQGVLAAGVVATTEAALLARAERRSKKGLNEDVWVKHKELAALGAGLLYFVGGKIASSFLSGEVQAIMKKFHAAGSAISTPEVHPVQVEPVHAVEHPPIVPTSPEVPEALPEHTPDPMAEKIPATPPIEEHPEPIMHEPSPVIDETSAPKIPETPHDSIPKEHLPVHAAHKTEITINDKLGIKGDSIWGSLRHNGVSERAIANYEKLHPHSILKLAHDKEKLSFIYDKSTDTLKEVKIESALKKVTGKAAKIAASHTIENHAVDHHPKGLISKDVKIKSPISTTHSSVSGKSIMDSRNPELPTRDAKDIMSMTSDKDSLLFENTGKDMHDIRMTDLSPMRGSLGGMTPEGAAEAKHYFKNLGGKAWRELGSAKASDVVSSKSPQALRDVLGKSNISIQDARSSKELIKPFLKAKITPKLNEKLSAYISRATEELLKSKK